MRQTLTIYLLTILWEGPRLGVLRIFLVDLKYLKWSTEGGLWMFCGIPLREFKLLKNISEQSIEQNIHPLTRSRNCWNILLSQVSIYGGTQRI